MSNRLGRSATQELTRIALVLSPRRTRGAWFTGFAWVVAALAIGGAGWVHWQQQSREMPQLTGAMQDNQRLQQQLEQSRLTLRLVESRSQELERQIDALNRRLHEYQEELTFFRKAREGHRSTPGRHTPGTGAGD